MRELGFARRWVARMALAVLPLLAAPTAAGYAAEEPPPTLRPVRIMVLVDESGSLEPEDLARERDAARIIAQGEPAAESTITVAGFASSNAAGQPPVDVVCPRTTLNTPQSRQFLADCLGRLRSRSHADGDGTDHVTALRQALRELSVPDAAGQPKLVFLLTDGVLDVSDSPAYGPSSADRNAIAWQQIPGLLDQLSRAGVQVWPLGFGKADQQQLSRFATGAAQEHCGFRTPAPTATVISGSAELLRAIGAAFSAARCASVGSPMTGHLPAGGSVDLTVEVPAIASEGTILVFKRDPRVTVRYLDPDSTVVPINRELGISRFELSGQGSPAEALRIVNPTPGPWTVRLSAAPGVPEQDVGAVAVFQGAIRADIAPDPPSPAPGSVVDVAMHVNGVQGAITKPDQLRGLSFVAELTGEGFTPVPPVELRDQDGHGQYHGLITVPATATGHLVFLGSVTGIGVSGDKRPFSTQIQTLAPSVQGNLTLEGDDLEVVTGTSISGTANVTNLTGQPSTLRIELVDQSPGAVLAVEPAHLTVPASGKAVLPFTVRFDPATRLGPHQARLRLVDESDGTQVAQLLFARDVVPEPSWPERHRLLLLLIGLALVGGIAAVIWRSRRRGAERDVYGVRVELRRHGQVIESLAARQHGEELRFGIRLGEGIANARLTTGPGGDRYRVRRGSSGLTLSGPSGEPVNLAPGGVLDLGEALQLAVHDRPAAGRPVRLVRGPSAGRGAADGGDRQRPRYNSDPYSNGDSANRARPAHDIYDNTP
jgi:hypothetical protein